MAMIIGVTNQKGGVGKTATCSALCGGFVNEDYRVLAVDLDPQGNLGFSLGAELENRYTIYDVFKGNATISQAIQHTEVCDVIPANILLSGIEIELTAPGREYILKERLKEVADEYDYIVIDTPPALSILTINAYTASNQLIIPMIPEVLSLQGIAQLKETIFAVQKYYNPDLEIRGILLNKYNARLNLTKEVEELAQVIAQQLNTTLFKQRIGNSIVVAEAPAHGETVFDYSPRSKSARDYKGFVYEYLGKELEEPKPRKKKGKRGAKK